MNNDKDLHFGEIIKSTLDKTRLTNKELAEKFGFTDVNLYRVYQKKDVNTELIRKTAEIAELDIKILFNPSIMSSDHRNNLSVYAESPSALSVIIDGKRYDDIPVDKLMMGRSSKEINLGNASIYENFNTTALDTQLEKLKRQVNELEKEIKHKEELIKLKDELIAVYKATGK